MARILAIHAHPDDAEILAGGTLALLADGGHQVSIATLTPGDCGSAELDPEEISAIRRGEAARAAALIGAQYLCVEMRDLAIFNDDPSRRRIVSVLRQVRPQLVITASPSDYLCDHEAASALVRDACFAAPAPNYQTPGEPAAGPLDAIPHLYFMDPLMGRDRENRIVEPDLVVDVTETFPRKREMLAAHASQQNWLRDHHGMDDYLAQMERWTAARGKLIGVRYGEGFRHYRGHPYPESPLLEALLGGRGIRYARPA